MKKETKEKRELYLLKLKQYEKEILKKLYLKNKTK